MRACTHAPHAPHAYARAQMHARVCARIHTRVHTHAPTHTRTHNRHCARPAFFPSLAAELALTLAGARPFAAGGSRVLHCMARVRRLSGDAPCCNAAGKHAQYDLALDRFRDALAHTPRSTKARLLPLPPARPPTHPFACHGSLCVRSCTCVRWRACARARAYVCACRCSMSLRVLCTTSRWCSPRQRRRGSRRRLAACACGCFTDGAAPLSPNPLPNVPSPSAPSLPPSNRRSPLLPLPSMATQPRSVGSLSSSLFVPPVHCAHRTLPPGTRVPLLTRQRTQSFCLRTHRSWCTC